jgi:uncharacterized damage-inducible protein DinB
MSRRRPSFDASLLRHTQRLLRGVCLPRIRRCLAQLSEDEIWWRPNPASNSAGNLVLHLEGNVQQWIISGLGGAPDRRQRDREFAEGGPIPRRILMNKLAKAVREAISIIGQRSAADLRRLYMIQGFQVSGLEAILHVAEHFSYHTGQIIFITKLRRGLDLRFTKLPRERTHHHVVRAVRSRSELL